MSNWIQMIFCAAIGTTIGIAIGRNAVSRDDVVTAKKFILVNEKDEKVGELGSNSDGAHLQLDSSSEDDARSLFASATGAGVVPKTYGIGSSISITAGPDSANLHFVAKDHQSLDLTSGDPFCINLTTRDGDGKERLMLYGGGKSKPVLNLTDKDGKEFDAFAGLKPPSAQEKKP